MRDWLSLLPVPSVAATPLAPVAPEFVRPAHGEDEEIFAERAARADDERARANRERAELAEQSARRAAEEAAEDATAARLDRQLQGLGAGGRDFGDQVIEAFERQRGERESSRW